ncbi:MAG: hypothetical protein KDB23_17915 [Planctomycetales bacterium]|nr:hypothetical protein [Planctomycetales bacterium]
MSDSTPPPLRTDVCPRCQATRRAQDQYCWLCSYKLPPRSGESAPGRRQAHEPIDAILIGEVVQSTPAYESLAETEDASFTFRIVDIILLITAICVVLGLYRVAPGGGIAVGAVLLPVFVRTMLVLRVRAARHLPTSDRERALLVVGSVLTTIGIYITGLAAAVAGMVAALLVFCGGLALSAGRLDESALSALMIVIGIAIAVIYLGAAMITIRNRWRRDTQD